MANRWNTDSPSRLGLDFQLYMPHNIISNAMMKKIPDKNLIELKRLM
jgi:hypothetical protein